MALHPNTKFDDAGVCTWRTTATRTNNPFEIAQSKHLSVNDERVGREQVKDVVAIVPRDDKRSGCDVKLPSTSLNPLNS
eukprot:m.198997 g.198997  ORF g.198997 m.198997 type:complete len:79 (+) comp32716_c0_seq2:1398-1634(+)